MKKNLCSSRQVLPLPVRIVLCVAIGAALTASNGAAVGVAIAAGLYLALTLGSRRA